MMRFRDLSIKHKLQVIILGTAGIALILSCLAFFLSDLYVQRRRMEGELAMLPVRPRRFLKDSRLSLISSQPAFTPKMVNRLPLTCGVDGWRLSGYMHPLGTPNFLLLETWYFMTPLSWIIRQLESSTSSLISRSSTRFGDTILKSAW